MTGLEAIPTAAAVLTQGIADGLHLGAQVAVRVDGQVVVDAAIGEARAGRAMTTDQMLIWWSMTKPTAAVAVAQQWERGKLDLDDRVIRYVPEFAANGKDRITIRHLLTHTGGFRGGDAVRGDWESMIAQICAAPLEPNWVPGETAGYHLQAGMIMLGEIVRRVDGRTYDRYIREELFEPLGMDDCWVGMPVERAEAYGERLGTMHLVDEPGQLVPRPELDDPDQLARPNPGGGGRGPMNQWVLFYEMLRNRGQGNNNRVLCVPAVEAITAKHRVGLYDKTFGVDITWGLGLQVDSYNMGKHCSRRAFGHGGARSSTAFADPEHGLAAAVLTNGMAPVAHHQARFHSFYSALYEDLGFVAAGSPGREKQPGKYA